jgi:hypothetical protein
MASVISATDGGGCVARAPACKGNSPQLPDDTPREQFTYLPDCDDDEDSHIMLQSTLTFKVTKRTVRSCADKNKISGEFVSETPDQSQERQQSQQLEQQLQQQREQLPATNDMQLKLEAYVAKVARLKECLSQATSRENQLKFEMDKLSECRQEQLIVMKATQLRQLERKLTRRHSKAIKEAVAQLRKDLQELTYRKDDHEAGESE